jgi:chemotaxis protein CheX
MQFDIETIAGLATDIWSSMLGIDVALATSDTPAAQVPTLTACVQITGDWTGAVTICCAKTAAEAFASAMFAADPSELSADEIRDALGELGNMTAGGVKGLVDGTCQLGIPAVAEGTSYEFSIPKGKITCQVDLAHGDEPIVISVYEMA